MDKYTFKSEKEKISLFEGNKEIGYVTFPIENSEFVRITHTFVDPSKRGEHLGDRLLEKVVETLREKHLKAVLICPFALHYFSSRPELSDILSLNEENFKIIRSAPNPIGFMELKAQDSHYLFASHDVPRPFGEASERAESWLINPNKDVIEAFYKEIILRECLFESFVNGDAVPSLQSNSYNELLLTLIDEAKEGAIEGFHGGIDTLIAIKKWGQEDIADSISHYKNIEDICDSNGLNLHTEFFETKPATID